jgi:metallo-beta-lactamase class B
MGRRGQPFAGRKLAGWAAALTIALGCAHAQAPARLFQKTPSEWTASQAPFRIAGPVYYVGSQDLAAYLIVTHDGLMLIDGGLAQNASMVLANIRALGFDPKRIRILLNSHAHLDHAGALAEIKAETGARLYASAGDRPLLESGGAHDPSLGEGYSFPPVKVDQVIGDGQRISLGGVTLTALLTPGHTPGCTTWSMPVKADGKVRQALFICSVSVLPSVRLAGPHPSWPTIAGDYARSFEVLKAQPCDIFLGAHASFYDMAAKRAKMAPGSPNPFIDPAGCKTYLARSEVVFHQRLAKDQAG